MEAVGYGADGGTYLTNNRSVGNLGHMEEEVKCLRETCEEHWMKSEARTDKVYCSDSCRTRDYRAKTKAELEEAVRKAVNARVRL